MIKKIFPAILSSLMLSACGTHVPNIGEAWENNSGATPDDLELQVKRKIYCEVQQAVFHQNQLKGFPEDLPSGKHVIVKRVPETWGVQVTIQFIVIENSALNPSATITPGDPTFSLAVGGGLSAEATRTDKYIFYYLVKDLDKDHPSCNPPFPLEELQNRKESSSLLANSDLGVEKWLNNAMNIRSVGVSKAVQQEVATYDIKFQIVSSGSISPLWKLTRVSTGTAGGSLFNTKRDRTHELILTFGPTQETETKKKPNTNGGGAQPSLIAANAALAQEIGSAVGAAVKNALSSSY